MFQASPFQHSTEPHEVSTRGCLTMWSPLRARTVDVNWRKSEPSLRSSRALTLLMWSGPLLFSCRSIDGWSGHVGEDEIMAWMPHMACSDKHELKQEKLCRVAWVGGSCKDGNTSSSQAGGKFEATPIERPTQACCALPNPSTPEPPQLRQIKPRTEQVQEKGWLSRYMEENCQCAVMT